MLLPSTATQYTSITATSLLMGLPLLSVRALTAGASFGSSQALAAGVSAMHVLYGQSPSDPEDQVLNVSRYLAAGEVTDWNNVYAMRIGFLTEALIRTEAPATERQYAVLNSAIYDYTDQLSRQVFTTTVTLLNY